MTEGLPRQQAFSIAAKRMFWPLLRPFVTTLAAFLPLMFWPGVPGKFMRYLPVTVFCVLSGSLLYALVFGPALGAVLGKAGARNQQAVDTLKELEDGDPTLLDGITGAYARALRWCSLHAGLTFLVTLVSSNWQFHALRSDRSRHHLLLRYAGYVWPHNSPRTRQSVRR